jgi:hypothetical protein
MQIRPANTAVADLDVDVGFLPDLRLKFLPDHFTVCGGGVEGEPAGELVVLLCHGDWWIVVVCVREEWVEDLAGRW